MKIVAMIRQVEVVEVEGEGPDRESARAAVDAKVPEGWSVLSYRTK